MEKEKLAEKEVKTEELTATETEGKEQPKAEEKVKETEKTDSVVKGEEENKSEVKTDEGKQSEPEPTAALSEPNAIPLSEVALKTDVKAMIDEALAPLRAKNAALEKENEDLKNALAEAKKDAEDTHAKYEKGDFGAPARRGEGFGETEAKGNNPNYTSYEDMWAGKTKFD